tara:strand:+ start:444 stop:662 length:219 start_codon:yes stop_codon:yes gene_type:complete
MPSEEEITSMQARVPTAAKSGTEGHSNHGDWHSTGQKFSKKIKHWIETGRMPPQTREEIQLRRDYLERQKNK